MKQTILTQDESGYWQETYEVNRKTAKKEIDEIFDSFNSSLRPGETKRNYSFPIKKKVIYFADPLGDLKSDCEHQVVKPLAKKGILFEKIKTMDTPPFNKENYDILFFDWGGMMIGNSLLESFCRQIIKEARKYPSKYYVMVSTFTSYAMKDAMDELSSGASFNIFLDINDFADNFNKFDEKSLKGKA